MQNLNGSIALILNRSCGKNHAKWLKNSMFVAQFEVGNTYSAILSVESVKLDEFPNDRILGFANGCNRSI